MNSLLLLAIGGVVLSFYLSHSSQKKRDIADLVPACHVAGWFAYKEYFRTNKDLTAVNADSKISAVELLQEFEKDDSAANRKYLGKILEVTGTVKEVTKDEAGFYTIALGEEGNLSSVRCFMDSVHKSDAANVTWVHLLQSGGPVLVIIPMKWALALM